jgi:hypothetical protein
MAREVTKADIMKARQAIADFSDLEQEIERAKALGLDCSEHDERCKHAKKFLIAFNEMYSPQVSPQRT